MKIFLLALLSIIIIVLFILFSEALVKISYNNKKLQLVFKIGFIRFKISPKTKNDTKKEKDLNVEGKIKEIKKKYKNNKELIDIFLDCLHYRIKIKKMEISLSYGTGDAATTGMLYGTIWGIISSAYKYLTKFFDLEFPKVDLTPDFQKSKFDFKFCGIVRIRLVHIINTLIKIYFSARKNKKKGANVNA